MEPNTDISISVDPAMADAIADEFNVAIDADGKPVRHAAFTAGRAAFDVLFSTSTALSQAERNIKAAGIDDPATTDRLRRAATSKMNTARKAASDGLAAIQAHVDQINASIDDTLGIPTAKVDVCEAGRCSDIRAYLRSLGESQRADAIRKAITVDNDAAVARAVLSASPLASGITKKEADFARVDAEERFARPAVRLRDSIGKLTRLLETAINATEARFGPLCGVGESPAAKAEAALRAVEGSAA